MITADKFITVTNFTKRRKTDESDDSFINKKMTSGIFGMNEYMCILNEGDETTSNLRKINDYVFQTMNNYASNKLNNYHFFEYRGDISSNVPFYKSKSFDHYIITEVVVKFARGYYAEDIDEVYFQIYFNLIHALFGRNEIQMISLKPYLVLPETLIFLHENSSDMDYATINRLSIFNF